MSRKWSSFILVAALVAIVFYYHFEHRMQSFQRSKGLKFYSEGLEAAQKNDNEKAAELFRQALKKNPKLFEAHLALGGIFLQQGDFEASELELQQAIDLNPKNSQVNFFLGYLYQKQGFYNKARANFENALATDPNLHRARLGLALAYANSNQYEKAQQEWQEIIKRAPESPEAEAAKRSLERIPEPDFLKDLFENKLETNH